MRRRIATLLGLASVMVVAFTPTALADTTDQFTVPLSGQEVVPTAGDPDGGGGVFMTLGWKSGTLCFFADTANISTPLTGVNLNQGARGQSGQMLVNLHGPSNDPDVSGCHSLSRDLVRDISKHRSDYYVELRNEEFPGGVLRGQLG